jgi:hypothetical protein
LRHWLSENVILRLYSIVCQIVKFIDHHRQWWWFLHALSSSFRQAFCKRKRSIHVALWSVVASLWNSLWLKRLTPRRSSIEELDLDYRVIGSIVKSMARYLIRGNDREHRTQHNVEAFYVMGHINTFTHYTL